MLAEEPGLDDRRLVVLTLACVAGVALVGIATGVRLLGHVQAAKRIQIAMERRGHSVSLREALLADASRRVWVFRANVALVFLTGVLVSVLLSVLFDIEQAHVQE